jgi:hypothetical protein
MKKRAKEQMTQSQPVVRARKRPVQPTRRKERAVSRRRKQLIAAVHSLEMQVKQLSELNARLDNQRRNSHRSDTVPLADAEIYWRSRRR